MISSICQMILIQSQTFRINLILSCKKNETLTKNPPIQIYPNNKKKTGSFLK